MPEVNSGGRVKISALPNIDLPDEELSNYYVMIEGADVEDTSNPEPKSYKLTVQKLKDAADISLYLTKLDPIGSGTFVFDGNQSISGNIQVGGVVSQDGTPTTANHLITKGILERYIADPYSNQATYIVGNYCVYNNILYICNTDINAPETFNPSKWTQIKLTAISGSGADTSLIAGEYNSSATYHPGAYVIHNDQLYKCISTGDVSGPWDPLDWDLTTVMHEIEEHWQVINDDHSNIAALTNCIADPYSTLKTYQIGDAIMRNHILYKCNTADTTGTWDSSKWDVTTVAELFVNGTNISY